VFFPCLTSLFIIIEASKAVRGLTKSGSKRGTAKNVP